MQDSAAGAITNRRYTTAVSKGAAMVDETRRLLQYWRPGEPLDTFAKRVQDDGLLGSATAYRTRDAVRRVFAPRFLRPTDKPARMLKCILEAGLPGRTFTEFVLLYACRNDPLVYDFILREFWPAARRGKLLLDADTITAFLSEAMLDGRIGSHWSDKVSSARNSLVCIRGRLQGAQ